MREKDLVEVPGHGEVENVSAVLGAGQERERCPEVERKRTQGTVLEDKKLWERWQVKGRFPTLLCFVFQKVAFHAFLPPSVFSKILLFVLF